MLIDQGPRRAAFPAFFDVAQVADLARGWVRRNWMGSQRAIQRYLQHELTLLDPWTLEASPFDASRYETMLEFAGSDLWHNSVVEVGCAAGVFTERLAPLCRELLVVDSLPAAIERASSRLKGRPNITWRVADIANFKPPNAFDVIIVSEVLYYLGGEKLLSRAIGNLVRLVTPGGVLIFGSATDAACARWGLSGGAETCISEFSRSLRETGRIHLRGATANEDCLIVRYSG